MRRYLTKFYVAAAAGFMLLALNQTALTSPPFFPEVQPPFKYVRADATGGDCASFGSWNAATLTCTMTADLTVPSGNSGIRVEGQGVSLQGQGHAISGTIPSDDPDGPIEVNYGIRIENDSQHRISNLQVTGFDTGISLVWSDRNEVSGTTLWGNGDGLSLSSSSENTIRDNLIRDNGHGVTAGSAFYGPPSQRNSFLANTFINDRFYCSVCTGNSFRDNAFSGPGAELRLNQSSHNTLTGNTVESDTEGFAFDFLCGDRCGDIMINDVDNTNMINGKPVYYLINAHGLLLEALDASLFICVECSDVTLKNTTFPDSMNSPVLLLGTDNSTLENLHINGVWGGVKLHDSHYNRITGNTVETVYVGVRLTNSSNNSVSGNNMSESGAELAGAGISAGEYSAAAQQFYLNNVITGHATGIYMDGVNEVAAGNYLSENGDGISFSGFRFNRADEGLRLYNNTLEQNETAIRLNNSEGALLKNNSIGPGNATGVHLDFYALGATITNNSFIDTLQNVEVGQTSSAVFHQPAPTGGNYWSNYDSEGEGCLNAAMDSFCDSPFVFAGGQDDLPWLSAGAWPDTVPPVVTLPYPHGQLRDSPRMIAVDFTDAGTSGVAPATIEMTLNGEPLQNCEITAGSISCPVAGLEPGHYGVGGAISDNAGNTAQISGAFSIVREYYFPWYDINASAGMLADWICVNNLGTDSTPVEIYVGDELKDQFELGPDGSANSMHFWQSMPMLVGGPVRVVSVDGQPLDVTQRTIHRDSFNEFRAADSSDLAEELYFPWYDSTRADGMMADWIMVSNPNGSSTDASIFLDGTLQAIIEVPPGATVPWHAPGDLRGGPLKIESSDGPVFASQRVIYHNSFTESLAHAAPKLDDRAFFSWYDNNHLKDWLLISNLGSETTTVNAYLGNNAQPVASFTLAVGESRQWRSPQPLLGGPLRVESDNGQNLLVSQRVIFRQSFEEIPASYENRMGNVAHFPWYDSMELSGFSNWIMVGSLDEAGLSYMTLLGDTTTGYPFEDVNYGAINGRSTVPVVFAQRAKGPVKTEAPWNYEFRPNPVVSQRVIYLNSFNELQALYTSQNNQLPPPPQFGSN